MFRHKFMYQSSVGLNMNIVLLAKIDFHVDEMSRLHGNDICKDEAKKSVFVSPVCHALYLSKISTHF